MALVRNPFVRECCQICTKVTWAPFNNRSFGDAALKSLNAIPTRVLGGGGSRLPTLLGPRVHGVGAAIGTRLSLWKLSLD
jgi:hypothetical protein